MENLGLRDINRTANGKNNLLRKRSLEARPTEAKNNLRKNTLSELSDFLWNKLLAVYRLEAVDTDCQTVERVNRPITYLTYLTIITIIYIKT